MFRLVKAESYILYKTRTFKVLCIIAILLGLMVIGTTKLVSSEDFLRSSLKGMSTEQQDEYISGLQKTTSSDQSVVEQGSGMGYHISSKDIFHPTAKDIFYGSFGVGAMEIIMAVLIGIMVASEYSSGTIKNILAYGKRREYYYISKLLVCTLGYIIILGIVVSVATIGGSILFGFGEPFTISEALAIIRVFLAAIAIGMGTTSVLMLIATLVKSNGATIGIGIVGMSVLPMIITFLYGKFDLFDRIYEATLFYNWSVIISSNSNGCDIFRAAIVGIVTMLIVTTIGITIFKKQDIK